MKKEIRIATRKSPLALWQAEHIKTLLESLYPESTVTLIPMVTKGDIILDSPLSKIGGKAAFVKELELALLENRADLAVHSMKDVPMAFPEGLHLSVICERESPYDAFVSNNYRSLNELPTGAVVGTSSLRRQAQIQAIRPDLVIKSLRGNVGTRLGKLDNDEYDAIILASAGLIRLGLNERIASILDDDTLLPAVGQGALGIETRTDDEEINQLLAPLADMETTYCVTAERAMNERLQGGCQVPIAGFAELKDNKLTLRALVASVDGNKIIKSTQTDSPEEAVVIGKKVADELLNLGAKAILDEVYDNA